MSETLIVIIGFSIVFLATVAGSALVFLFKKDFSPKLNTIFLGFASGVMVAASIWSLLIPALDGAKQDYDRWGFLPVVIGFVLGGLFLVAIDKIVPHFHSGTEEEEGLRNQLNKSTKMFLAVTIHNIPEGLAVGFTFGAAAVIGTNSAFIAALGLAIGMAVQNFPEGAAISLPMKAAIGSRTKAFLYGAASGIVEPLCAVIGYFLVGWLVVAQPWLLAFAAGAMIFVVVEDLIPDAHLSQFPHLGTWGMMVGFCIMMALEVALA